MNIRTLEEALQEALKDDNKVSKYEARVIRELITADGAMTDDERKFLGKALMNNRFDQQAFELLTATLLRADL